MTSDTKAIIELAQQLLQDATDRPSAAALAKYIFQSGKGRGYAEGSIKTFLTRHLKGQFSLAKPVNASYFSGKKVYPEKPKTEDDLKHLLASDPEEQVELKTTEQITEEVMYERKIRVLRGELSDLKRKNKQLMEDLDISEKRLDSMLAIKEDVDLMEIDAISEDPKKEATALVMLSDWHVEEKVDPKVVNYINEFNPEIASARAFTCFQNALKLVRKERHDANVNQLLLWLGGDFISGYIHEELEEENFMSPTQATRFVKQLLIAGIEFMIDHGEFESIKIVCNIGNHGRTGKKKRVASSYKNSYEWMLYHDLNDYFSKHDMVEFHIPEGLFSYTRLYDKFTIRSWHGDNIRYGGGIGGLTIPLNKVIFKLNSQIKADYNIIGHFHQYWEATKDCLVNGSLIGINAYALSIGASPEPPMQGFRIIHSEHGLTTKLPILCE
jgi:hypothetical protein